MLDLDVCRRLAMNKSNIKTMVHLGLIGAWNDIRWNLYVR